MDISRQSLEEAYGRFTDARLLEAAAAGADSYSRTASAVIQGLMAERGLSGAEAQISALGIAAAEAGHPEPYRGSSFLIVSRFRDEVCHRTSHFHRWPSPGRPPGRHRPLVGAWQWPTPAHHWDLRNSHWSATGQALCQAWPCSRAWRGCCTSPVVAPATA